MNAYKKYIAELVGTFALVFIAAGSLCADFYLRQTGGQGLGLLGTSVAYGVVVIAVIYAISYVSGSHVNPAVTISFWLTKGWTQTRQSCTLFLSLPAPPWQALR